jgi:hypothetical protein
MTDEQIKEYRAEIASQLKEKETEIETNITNITVALLGFFLTINEKFIPLKSSHFKVLFLISVVSFVTSFFLGLRKKWKTSKIDRDIIDFIDNNDLKIRDIEIQLDSKWKSGEKSLNNFRNWIYSLLFIGLITQLIYLYLNLNSKVEENDNIKIEIPNTYFDTIINSEKTKIQIDIKSLKKDTDSLPRNNKSLNRINDSLIDKHKNEEKKSKAQN